MTSKKSTIKRTEIGRGLGQYLDAKDSIGRRFRVQESSDAIQPCVWILTDQVTHQHLGHDMHAALHLTRRNAKDLVAALKLWLKETRGG